MNSLNNFLKKASKEVKPIYAQAFFSVSREEVTYYLVFDYFDKYRYYEKIVTNKKLYDEEMRKLFWNMQYFLNLEKIKVNDKFCKPEVISLDLGFRDKLENPYITFLIGFKIETNKGINIYENQYESEYIEYDYRAYWCFPKDSKIISVEMKENYEIVGERFLVIYGKKGSYSSGYEKIIFNLS
jgi:hypothetical protein